MNTRRSPSVYTIDTHHNRSRLKNHSEPFADRVDEKQMVCAFRFLNQDDAFDESRRALQHCARNVPASNPEDCGGVYQTPPSSTTRLLS